MPQVLRGVCEGASQFSIRRAWNGREEKEWSKNLRIIPWGTKSYLEILSNFLFSLHVCRMCSCKLHVRPRDEVIANGGSAPWAWNRACWDRLGHEDDSIEQADCFQMLGVYPPVGPGRKSRDGGLRD
jgi:hypothetical protein